MRRPGPLAVSALYLAFSFALLLFTSARLPEESRFLLFENPGVPSLWSPGLLESLTWLCPLAGALILALADLIFRGGRSRTAGMMVTAASLVALSFGLAFLLNSREVLPLAWPGMIAVALLWLLNLDRDYSDGTVWKWEVFFAGLIGLATLAFIPFALMLGQPTIPRVFHHSLAMVVTHGIGLLLLYYAFLLRLSPESKTNGILPLLGLCGRVITAVFRSGSVHGDTSMTIASVNNSLTDLLRDMMAGTLRTIMYTDIRQSTETIERLGDLDAYHLFQRSWDLSCEELRHRNATSPKDVGDGLITTFDSPTEAVSAARGILQAHEEYNTSAREEERLHLKIGLHTGEILLHQGWDPRGRDSHVAARVVSASDPGCITVTRQTFDALSEKGVRLEGEWREGVALKGFLEKWDLLFLSPLAVIDPSREAPGKERESRF